MGATKGRKRLQIVFAGGKVFPGFFGSILNCLSRETFCRAMDTVMRQPTCNVFGPVSWLRLAKQSD
jgi:hypothetical protein